MIRYAQLHAVVDVLFLYISFWGEHGGPVGVKDLSRAES